MDKRLLTLSVLFMLALAPAGTVVAKDDGIWNRSNGCSCHNGGSSFTATLTGLPSAYVAGTSYTLTVGMSSSPNTGGFNLEVNHGTLSNPDANSQVSSNGRQATHGFSPGTTTWTMDWTAPQTGTGSVQINLAVLSANSNGGTSGDAYDTLSVSLSEEVSANTAPAISNVVLSPSGPTTVDDVSVSYTYVDDDGDQEAGTTFQWFLNGVLEGTHTTATLPSTATARGQVWQVEVSPSDGIATGNTVASSTVEILNSAPAITMLTVSDEAPDTSESITYSTTSSDADGDTTTEESRWRLNGVPFPPLDNSSVLTSASTRPGDSWDVQVRVSDAFNTSEWFTSPSILIGSSNSAPSVSQVSISPATGANTDDVLEASWVESDADGDAIIEHQLMWANNGVHVPEADGMNPLDADMTSKGDAWTVQVRASDGTAWSSWTNSDQASIGNAAPTILSASIQSPSFTAVDNLTVQFQAEDPDGDVLELAEVGWHLNGGAESATGPTLDASLLNRGDQWHAVLTITDGEDVSLQTTPTILIENAAPSVSIVWNEESNAMNALAPELTVEDVDGDATVLTTNWYKNGFRDAALSNATSIPVSKLAPGQTWTLEAQASDGSLNSSRTESSYTVPNLLPNAVIEVRSTNQWVNEFIVLTGEDSLDADGSVAAYRWTWDGLVRTGPVISVVVSQNTEVSLTVIDEHGGQNTSAITLRPLAGPSVSALVATYDGTEDVRLTWTWNGDENVVFDVLRNGRLVGTTESTSFVDQPPLSGSNLYTIQPMTENRTFLQAVSEQSVETSVGAIDEPAPDQGWGLALGLVLLSVMVGLQMASRRRGVA